MGGKGKPAKENRQFLLFTHNTPLRAPGLSPRKLKRSRLIESEMMLDMVL